MDEQKWESRRVMSQYRAPNKIFKMSNFMAHIWTESYSRITWFKTHHAKNPKILHNSWVLTSEFYGSPFCYYITHSEILIIRQGGISLPLLKKWYPMMYKRLKVTSLMPLQSWFSMWFLFESCQVSLVLFGSLHTPTRLTTSEWSYFFSSVQCLY